MFNKAPPRSPDPSPTGPQSRVTHTPGAYPPLQPRGASPQRDASVVSAAQAAQMLATAPVPEPAKTAPTPTSATGAADGESGCRLIVGPDVKLKGAEILDCDTLVVEGRVEATMDSRVIRITERGAYSGKVCVDLAELHGNFEGDLTVRQQLIIHATGRVKGTIRYGSLLIESGGQISGDIQALETSRAADSRIAGKEVDHAKVTSLMSSAA